MKKYKAYCLLISFFVLINGVTAQDFENMKFGKVGTADFQVTAPAFDSNASAVIIKDYGKTEYVGNTTGFFGILYKRFIRVKILNKNGYGAADFRITIPNYKTSSYAKISDIKGSTFNVENGVVRETKLDPKSVFTEKYGRYHDVIKFALPAIKDGSVFDLTYTLESSYVSDPPNWVFQGDFPCLWSEYEATIPSAFHYLTRIKGDSHFDIKTSKAIQQNFTIREEGGGNINTPILSVRGTSFQNRWVKKNVPVLKKQPYISSMDNYTSQISFELDYFQQDERYEKEDQRETWNKVSQRLLAREDFGFDLDQDNHWMDEELKTVTAGALNAEDETRRIFNYVRDNFKCTDHDDILTNYSIKKVFGTRAGNVAEINLLLVALLRHQSIHADPAILSTRTNGIATEDNPMLHEYNYVICVAHPAGKTFLLDASTSFNFFNNLPAYCYNGSARTINQEHPDLIVLNPDSLTETKMTSAIFNNDDNGIPSGSITTRFGNDEAYDVREYVKQNSLKDFFKTIQDRVTDMKVSNESFDSLNLPDFPLVLHYDLDFKNIKDVDVLYFTPVPASVFRKNPFIEATRTFPVEMLFKTDYTYVLSMEVPKGFQVDELPKSARTSLIGSKGSFDYLIQQAGGSIQMRVHLKLNEATFNPDEYDALRDFFAYVVKKESEQIVFKKIK